MNVTIQKTLGKSPAEIILGRRLNRERWVNKGNIRGAKREEDSMRSPRRTFSVAENVLVKVEQNMKDEDRFEGP